MTLTERWKIEASPRDQAELVGLLLVAMFSEIDFTVIVSDGVDRGRDALLALLITALAIRSLRVANAVALGLTSPAVGLAAMLSLGAAAAIWSVTPFTSLATCLVSLGLLFACSAAVQTHGWRLTVRWVAAGLSLLIPASLLWETLGSGTKPNWAGIQDTGLAGLERHAGIVGDPNAFGRVGALVFLVGLVSQAADARSGVTRPDWPARWFVFSGLFCLAMAQSRTAIGAAVAGLAVVMSVQRKGKLAVTMVAGAMVLGLGILSSGASAVDFVVREGSGSEELTSATGRTEVWDLVLATWDRHPLVGHGAFGAGKVLETAHAQGLVWEAADAHNLVLNTLLTQGLLGVLCLAFVPLSVVLSRTRCVVLSTTGPLLLGLVVLSTFENTLRKPSAAFMLAVTALCGLAVDAWRNDDPVGRRMQSDESPSGR